jgi:hypothetical protein
MAIFLEQSMTFGWMQHGPRWIATLALALLSHGVLAETIAWTQDARLHDGRSVTVSIEGSSTKLPYYLAYQRSPINQFKMVFRHPDTQQPIVWQGARYFSPVLLDVVNGTPYLVVYGRPTQETLEAYGCPELPYIFLRHGPGGWEPIAANQAPAELTAANLSTHEAPSDTAGRHLTSDEVSQQIVATEQQTSGLLQKAIPRILADWHAKNRRMSLNDRLVGDCRPPRTLQPPLVLPPPKHSATELLETVEFVPDASHTLDDWRQKTTDTRRTDACISMFQAVEPDPYNQDMRFTLDPTGKKRVPYTRQGEWEPGLRLMCGAHLWFITTQNDPNTLTITQTTQGGDPVFRVSFPEPASDADMVGTLLWPTLRADAGYVYFDWAFGHADGNQWLVKRILKLRVPLQ